MSNKALLASEGHLVTNVGKAFLSERVVMRGRDLHRDLGNMSWFALHLYGITGRDFTDNELKLLNYLWVSTSYPDPSIWPNNTAALAGSARATIIGRYCGGGNKNEWPRLWLWSAIGEY